MPVILILLVLLVVSSFMAAVQVENMCVLIKKLYFPHFFTNYQPTNMYTIGMDRWMYIYKNLDSNDDDL